MTERTKTNKKSAPPQETSFIDNRGVPRVVFVPKGETDLHMGIPVSLDVTALYPHMPDSFQRDLTEALHAVGLIKPADYFVAGASDRFRAAMLSVIRRDFLDAQALAKEAMGNRL